MKSEVLYLVFEFIEKDLRGYLEPFTNVGLDYTLAKRYLHQLIDEPIRKQRTAVHSMLSDAPRLHSWQTLNRKPWFTFARTIACSRAASEPGASCLPASKLFTCCATRARSRAANVSVLKRARAEVMRKARP